MYWPKLKSPDLPPIGVQCDPESGGLREKPRAGDICRCIWDAAAERAVSELWANITKHDEYDVARYVLEIERLSAQFSSVALGNIRKHAVCTGIVIRGRQHETSAGAN